MEKVLSAKPTILYLLSFQGYLSIPKAVRLLLRYHKNRWDQRYTASLWKQSCSKLIFRFSIRAKWRLVLRRLGQESLRSDKKDENDWLADVPFWFEVFMENLKPTEVHAPAHTSQDSYSEHPAKVARKSRTHSIFTHFPKGRNCGVCLRTKITKASCRRRTGEALPRAEKFGDLTTADHNVFNEGCESRDNHRYAVAVQDLATQWIQSYPCKTNLHIRRKKAY